MMAGVRNRSRALRRLGERLLTDGVIGDDQLRQALERQRISGGFLGEILVSLGFISSGEIGKHLEQVTGFPFVDIAETEIDRNVAALLPESFVAHNRALPFKAEAGKIHVAMADPLDLGVVDEIKGVINRPVISYLALGADLDEAIKRTYDVRARTRAFLDELSDSGVATPTEDSLDDLLDKVDDAPIVKLVNSILSGAVSAGASDIHIEPQEDHVRVRYRIDGVMYDQMNIPRNHLAACVSRLKVMSRLDIAERRRPQDGRFATRDEKGHEFDVRLSIMPTVNGEKACMRLLEKANSLAKIEKLGFFPDQRVVFEKFIQRPHGLVLVTGPTGSGKSTTLYAALQMINDSTRNINTVEDPVEYKLQGVNQMQVNPKIGVTFASGLRTLVRQDPDVILVGEIRDKETAEIAIQAALTGHLVLSTLHTNDAPGALVRLQNMGVEPFLISSAVIGVMGQRLMRTLCTHCRETYMPHEDEALAAGIALTDGEIPMLARPKGCRRCGMRGMRGRSAAVEIMPMTDPMRDLVLQGASGADLTHLAIAEGMQTMRQAAVRKALDHTISPSEILRVFSQDE